MSEGPRPVKRQVLRCAVDVWALKGYRDGADPEADLIPVHKDGSSYGWGHAPPARVAQFLTKWFKGEDALGMGNVDITYRHSAFGAALVAAGHVAASREYAIDRTRADPFNLP